MKRIKIVSCLLGYVLSFSACTSTFDEMNTNPDATTQVKSSMLATTVIKDMVTKIWEYNEFLSRRMLNRLIMPNTIVSARIIFRTFEY